MVNLEDEINPGLIEKFFEQLPERAFHLGIRMVLAGLAFLIGIQLIRLVRRILKKAMKRGNIDEGALHFVDSFVKFSLYFVLILLISTGLGVDATSILALLGSAGVAIGLAIQGSLSNFAGGLLILGLKPFQTGDYIIDSHGNEGYVKLIDIFYTRIQTLDNKMIVLPNGNLANNAIINCTRFPERCVDVFVSIAYNEDIEKARKIILEKLEKDGDILPNHANRVLVNELAESGVVLQAKFWINKDGYWDKKSHITESIKKALDEAGIKIPFPQMDVHMS